MQRNNAGMKYILYTFSKISVLFVSCHAKKNTTLNP